ncbi:hypothetical protein ZWY2020_046229 [Hordeum vulgare]|nr:hypothetical protein ZWY2020_046229 [Hordeum vulgare]
MAPPRLGRTIAMAPPRSGTARVWGEQRMEGRRPAELNVGGGQGAAAACWRARGDRGGGETLQTSDIFLVSPLRKDKQADQEP